MRYWYRVNGETYYFADYAPTMFHHFVTIHCVAHFQDWRRISEQITQPIADGNIAKDENFSQPAQTLRIRLVKYTLNDDVVDWLRRNVQCGQTTAHWGTYLSNGTSIDIAFKYRRDALKFVMCWGEGLQQKDWDADDILEITPIGQNALK